MQGTKCCGGVASSDRTRSRAGVPTGRRFRLGLEQPVNNTVTLGTLTRIDGGSGAWSPTVTESHASGPGEAGPRRARQASIRVRLSLAAADSGPGGKPPRRQPRRVLSSSCGPRRGLDSGQPFFFYCPRRPAWQSRGPAAGGPTQAGITVTGIMIRVIRRVG